MTEQDGAVLAARLTRVWELSGSSFNILPNGTFSFRGNLSGALILFADRNHQHSLSIELAKDVIGSGYDWMLVSYFGEIFDCRREQTYDCHISGELTFFRRNCWLSGCPIEATAHEKAEWVRDFSREEIEAWNLKF